MDRIYILVGIQTSDQPSIHFAVLDANEELVWSINIWDTDRGWKTATIAAAKLVEVPPSEFVMRNSMRYDRQTQSVVPCEPLDEKRLSFLEEILSAAGHHKAA